MEEGEEVKSVSNITIYVPIHVFYGRKVVWGDHSENRTMQSERFDTLADRTVDLVNCLRVYEALKPVPKRLRLLSATSSFSFRSWRRDMDARCGEIQQINNLMK